MELNLPSGGSARPAQTFSFLGFVWDVDVANRLAAGHTARIKMPVGRLAAYLPAMGIDEKYALSPVTDLSRPLIAVRIGGLEGIVVIDGWHRVFKAAARRIPELPCIVLNETEERLARIAGSVKRRGGQARR